MLIHILLWFKLMLSDKDGKPSAHRFIAVYGFILFSFVWAIVSIKSGTMANITEITQLVVAIGSLISILFGKIPDATKIISDIFTNNKVG